MMARAAVYPRTHALSLPPRLKKQMVFETWLVSRIFYFVGFMEG